MPSYGKDVEDELTLWLNQRYYSDPLPSGHPVAIRPEWRSAIQSLTPSSNVLRDVQGMALAKDELLIRRYSPLLENPSVKPLLVSGSSIDPFLSFVYVAMTRSASENAVIEGRVANFIVAALRIVGILWAAGVNCVDAWFPPESRHRIRDDFIASGRLPFGEGEDLVKRELESTERAAELEKMYREQQKEQNKHEQRRIEFP
ncbi:hypothetical protein Pmar_PMAR007494 [Perkinsus marinus ATCC 50983]|uniref:Uncharacterized protein n=1 Tax=Perkinsus marinus (strain ATCC 50983 / TXsc) TaxID=423536 RepID=C5M066_PERM5|nr:hypothetical protein Pmar_PMAR007494 [Perkinsus marinus ATCC 50983]EEQ97644.1 hypothetical protein Pmar_PMAR007494 [Perkinsus marinus ATCC 50983]|eukprot:XP_002764927.1 hypothetical protein Pmar_PMAR007494 [Perkinsus marinus ATCC 50983]